MALPVKAPALLWSLKEEEDSTLAGESSLKPSGLVDEKQRHRKRLLLGAILEETEMWRSELFAIIRLLCGL